MQGCHSLQLDFYDLRQHTQQSYLKVVIHVLYITHIFVQCAAHILVGKLREMITVFILFILNSLLVIIFACKISVYSLFFHLFCDILYHMCVYTHAACFLSTIVTTVRPLTTQASFIAIYLSITIYHVTLLLISPKSKSRIWLPYNRGPTVFISEKQSAQW